MLSIIGTIVTIAFLNDVKNDIEDNEDFDEIIDAAITRIGITLALQLVCLALTVWWFIEVNRSHQAMKQVVASGGGQMVQMVQVPVQQVEVQQVPMQELTSAQEKVFTV